MDFLDDEHNNAQKAIELWKRNRFKVYAFIALGFILVCLNSYWESEVVHKKQAALDHYTSFVFSLDEDDRASMMRSSQLLKDNFSKSLYTSLAQMRQVKFHIENEEYEPAYDLLVWLKNYSPSPEISTLAQLKLLELHLVTKNYNEAQQAMNAIDAAELDIFVKEMQGNLFFLQGDYQQAVDIYREIIHSDEVPKNLKEILIAKVNYFYDKRIVQ